MTEIFTWGVLASTSGAGEFVVRESRFGDGYTQAVAGGLNNERQDWDVGMRGTAAQLQPAIDFLRARAGAESFFWTPPLGAQRLFRCKKYTLRPSIGVQYELSATFEQGYAP